MGIPERPKYLDKAREEATRIMGAKSVGSIGGTNWRPDHVPMKQPNFFGEGSGFNLGLDGPKHSFHSGRNGVVFKEESEGGDSLTESELLAAERRLRQKKFFIETDRAYAEVIQAKIAVGMALTGCRIFFIPHPNKHWEKKAQRQGIPEEVDLAITEFGLLIIVPVIEFEAGVRLGLSEKVAYKDTEGRRFWIRSEIQDRISRLFGWVRWRTPVSVESAIVEFGVNIVSPIDRKTEMKEIFQIKPCGSDGRIQSHGILVEEKLDGHRGLLHFGGGLRRTHLTGRRKAKGTAKYTEKALNVPQISEAGDLLAEAGWGYTVLDGEVQIPGHPFEDVQSVMGASASVAVDWQQRNTWAVYTVFDCLFFNGEDLRGKPLRVRRKYAEQSVERLQVYSDEVRFIGGELVDTKALPNRIQSMFDTIIRQGGEGLMLKDPNAKYGTGWMKMKGTRTDDVVIMGFSEGNGKYEGMIGAVRFGAYDSEGRLIGLGQCSGMSDSQRLDFTENSESYVGKVIEVKSNGMTRKGRLRHPQFYRHRSDKSATECKVPETL